MSTFRNKGIALFIALALLLLLSIGVAVFLLNTYRHVNINEAIANRARAMLIAESGIAYAYWKIRVGEDDAGSPVDFYDGNLYTLDPTAQATSPMPIPTGWTIAIDVQDIGSTGTITIDSTVDYPKSTAF